MMLVAYTVAASLGHITVERIDSNRQRETVTLNLAGRQGPQADRQAIDAFQVQDGDRVRVEPILPYSERVVYLEGHVARPGRLPYTDGMRLGDVLHSYRDMLPEPAAHGEIIRLVPPDLHAETIDFDVPDVLIGNGNVALQPFDTIRIFGRYEVDAPKVTILGEVLRPGAYPLSKGMTAAQLVRMAGGFKRDALLEKADLTSYDVTNGNRIVESVAMVPIGEAVAGRDPNADLLLKPGDILTIHQITGWNDIGESITIDGQVKFPGNYGFHDGERLSSVLRRAGGFLSAAYPMGAVLVREQVRELEQKSREELIRQIETNSAAARLSPNLASGDGAATLQLIKAQQQEVLQDLKSHPPTGRMVIHITADIDSWANTPADIELRRGDVLTIPKQPGFVLVTGQVYNATALTFAPGQSAGWYLSHAGGTNSTANRKEIFIIRANGSVIGRRSGEWFDANVLSTKLNPGDVVVVPQKIIGASLLWKNLLTTAQLASSIAITASVAVPVGNMSNPHNFTTMIPASIVTALERDEQTPEHWAVRASLLWKHRRLLARVTMIAFLVSLSLAFLIPKRYKSSGSIMPPDQQSSGAMMLAALAHSSSLGGLGSLASGLLGTHTSTALFINLLHSGTVSGHLIDRFQLQHLYRNRYRVDTAKHLAHLTTITEDKKSGVITVEVEDEDPVRARDMAQAYLDELNKLVTQTSTSSAHRERVFIERTPAFSRGGPGTRTT